MKECSRILIIDDSTYICCQVEQIFKNEEKIELKQANSGKEALACITSFQPDLVLLDVILPDIEGYELYHHIKELDHNHAAIIFLTSKDQDDDMIKGLSLGACDYIKKPFSNAVLKSRVFVHLKEKQAKDELRLMNESMEANMKKLNVIAYRDALTGLYNRRYVHEQLMQDLLKKNTSMVLLMCDIDDFKHINDYYGHEMGDVVLIGIANIMESCHPDLHVTRWGGEEFLLILTGKTKEEAFNISELVRRNIESFTFTCKQVPFHCTVSIGLSIYDEKLGFKENLDHADQALYVGKRSGKNCSIWFDGIYK